MNGITVERADLSDLYDIARLEREYIPCPWSENQLRAAMEDERYSFFAVRENGKAVAYGGVCFALDEAEICNVVTDEKFRGKGFAKRILERIELECRERGAVKMFLEVAENNAPAKNLYSQSGFEKISLREDYYGKGLAAEIMQKEIK